MSTTPHTTAVGPTVTLAIDGMSCGHCVAAVRQALQGVGGLATERVAVGSATVAIDPAASADAVLGDAIQAIEDAGYAVRLATDDAARALRSSRTLPQL